VLTDAKVVSGQIEKECRANTREIFSSRRMKNYFKELTVEYIERNKNTEIDDITKAAHYYKKGI
jgi:CRISPR/Cas system CSM-associated protein Csm3 (group 7 of RAMP superfamily)